MRWFYDLKIATKLFVAFGMVLLLTLVMGVSSIYSMGRVNQVSRDLTQKWMPGVRVAMNLRTDLAEMRRWELAHLLADDDKAMAGYEKRMDEIEAGTNADRAAYGKLISTDDERALAADFDRDWTTFMTEHPKVMALSRQHQKTEARALLIGPSAKSMAGIFDTVNKLVKLNTTGGDAASDAAGVTYDNARMTAAVLLVLNIGIGITLAAWIARVVSEPLQQAVSLARAVAGGDLTHDIEARSVCETGQLMQALREMTGNLGQLVSQVRGSTETIATASAQIASGNLDLSSRTEEQASSLEETAASMEELTSTVKQNADNARQANELALSASDIAARGGEAVARVVETMDSINDSSAKIVDIISVIDGIAFQTNILALNAAVEAARAGEQGRGFAVVASEVRTLAQRSAAAAKDIKALIGDSVDKVRAGSQLVNVAGTTMDKVVTSITRVTDIMREITSASMEQSQGIEQVNQAITQMDQVTQQNAALVEQAAAAAESMQDQAIRLSEVVRVFKLASTGSGATPVRRMELASAAQSIRPVPSRLPATPPSRGDDWQTF